MMSEDGTNLLGNLVNNDANHLTGGSYVYGPGKRNFDLTLDLLRKLEVRLG
jgi:hypothetical protein